MKTSLWIAAAFGLALGFAPTAWAQDAEPAPKPETGDVEVDRVDPLGDIAEEMDAATRRLDKGKAGTKAQTAQRRAIAKLDQLIESLKKR